MKTSPTSLLFLVFFLLDYYGIDALHCYECNSHNDSRCASEVPPDALKVNCAEHERGSQYTMCRKITQVIEFSVNGLQPDHRVIRSCGYDESNYKGRCYQRSGFGGRQEVCSCLSDYCNAATPGATLTSSALVAACALVAFALARD